MILQYALYTAPGGSLLADYATRARDLAFTTNARGYAECSAFIPMSLPEMLQLYDTPGLPHVVVRDEASGRAFEGRLEDVKIQTAGLTLTAFGYARALSDVPYTAMWSVSRLDDYATRWSYYTGSSWQPTNLRYYSIDNSDTAVRIGMVKDTAYAFNARGEMVYHIPHGSSRQITGAMVAFEFWASANMTMRITSYTFSATYPYYTFDTNLYSLVGTGAAQSGAVLLSFTGVDMIAVGLEATTSHVYADEDGAEYVRFDYVRLVSGGTLLSTTTTASRSNGSAVTVTVGSTSGMYVGQRLLITGSGKSELTTVLSVPTSTTFTADIVNGTYASGATVTAWSVTADQVVSDLLSTTRAVNSAQLSSDTALIQSPAVDLLDETYLDHYPADILDDLAVRGDTSSQIWEWGVMDDRVLSFRPQYTTARAWYTDTRTIEIERTLESLTNSVYATYTGPDGAETRTLVSTDSTSVAQYGLTRRTVLASDTTSTAQTDVHIAATLSDGATAQPRSRMALSAVYDAFGNRANLTEVRAGDTLTVRNLPPNLSSAVDRVRTFRIARAEYEAETDTLQVEPGSPPATLEVILAAAVAAITSGSASPPDGPGKRRSSPLPGKGR